MRLAGSRANWLSTRHIGYEPMNMRCVENKIRRSFIHAPSKPISNEAPVRNRQATRASHTDSMIDRTEPLATDLACQNTG